MMFRKNSLLAELNGVMTDDDVRTIKTLLHGNKHGIRFT